MRDEDALPKRWSNPKKKVFRLVRQIYGQMVSGGRRYGIVHTYERCYFCKRTEEGKLKISRPFQSSDTSPSVFHAIKTLNGLGGPYILAEAPVVHPRLASKAPPKKRTRDNEGNSKRKTSPSGFPPYHPGNRTSEDEETEKGLEAFQESKI